MKKKLIELMEEVNLTLKEAKDINNKVEYKFDEIIYDLNQSKEFIYSLLPMIKKPVKMTKEKIEEELEEMGLLKDKEVE